MEHTCNQSQFCVIFRMNWAIKRALLINTRYEQLLKGFVPLYDIEKQRHSGQDSSPYTKYKKYK